MENIVGKTYLIYKELGETPLEALLRLRAHFKLPESLSMTYAGRLDPAAEGVLVVLVGDECRNKLSYTDLPKTYEAEILLGVATDSYDLLGMPVAVGLSEVTVQTAGDLFVRAETWLAGRIGTHAQTYPPYSSKAVGGRQLHAYAKEGKIVDLPTHMVTLYSYVNPGIRLVKSHDVVTRAERVAGRVTGDFRQAEISGTWRRLGANLPDELPVLKLTLEVGSGFYVRQLAEDLGRVLGTGACLYSLIRTKVGTYTV